MEANRGPGGGYRLARHPDSITAEDVIQAFQDDSRKVPAGRTEELSGLWQQFCLQTRSFWGPGRWNRLPPHPDRYFSGTIPTRSTRWSLPGNQTGYAVVIAECE
ncbi:Rrf2 family transcriptional regulator [Enterobacter asburiae]|uniref:Rrf2 family transcriptional regulator n=1 Tax=Enterobacter asburiae TaxID=61645 RepID=UPI002074C3D1|nr:Rrf2 family transcriptional regulator [Enterobacter asburiae]